MKRLVPNTEFLPFKPKTKSIDGTPHVFDMIRKKYLVLTPEELVRQSFINYLITDLNYPRAMIAVERGVKTSVKSNRSDIYIMTEDSSCFMLIECKSFRVKINQDTFDQAAKYATKLKAAYLVTTNGLQTYCCAVDHGSKHVAFLDRLPGYPHAS